MSAPTHSPELSEPQTPMWLPALGGLFFAAVFVYWATLPASPAIVADTAASASAAAPVAPSPSTAPLHMARGPAGGSAPAGAPMPRTARPPIDPSKAGDIQRLLNRVPKNPPH